MKPHLQLGIGKIDYNINNRQFLVVALAFFRGATPVAMTIVIFPGGSCTASPLLSTLALATVVKFFL